MSKKYFFIFLLYSISIFLFASNESWKAGVAKIDITPKYPIWMAGYATRLSPSEGKLHNIYAKALVLEDAVGKNVVLVTMDILGIPKDISDYIRKKIIEKYGFEKSDIILSSSHTHSGPVVSPNALKYIYPMDDSDRKVVERYTKTFTNNILEVVDNALNNKEQVKIFTGNGTARFQVNRRNNDELTINNTTKLTGPIDYAVPVIKIENFNNEIIAVVFGYACHPTVLNVNMISGDYPGYAQIELEKMYPKTTAMFFQGAAGDINPLPRRSIPLTIQYGKQLSATVECVLSGKMDEQPPKLTTIYKEINLPFDKILSNKKLNKISKEKDYSGNWAKGLIKEINSGITQMSSYPYPIEIWKIGNQKLFVLGGEVLSSYSVRLKEKYGQDIFVMAYSNDVMGYIPSKKIINEGGYEGDISQRAYGLPSKWNTIIETQILETIYFLNSIIDKDIRNSNN